VMDNGFWIEVMGVFAASAFAAAAGIAAGEKRRPEDGPPRVPVVIELFTSEGCSSCPPADELLTRLAATQPVAGAEILALGEHVDYWNHLGWRDPFSSRTFSERQAEYDRRAFQRGSVYTPQMVVNGRVEFTGSNADAALAAVKDAIHQPEPRVQVTLGLQRGPTDGSIVVSVNVAPPRGARLGGDAEVFLALTQDDLESQVRDGENGGRRLHHSAVVRSLRSMGYIRVGEGAWSGTSFLEGFADGKVGASRVVAFVQERESRWIVGAASAVLTGDLPRP
jgi:hypothetical protein